MINWICGAICGSGATLLLYSLMVGKRIQEVTKHDCPLELLGQQQAYMRAYLCVLEKRALIENIKL